MPYLVPAPDSLEVNAREIGLLFGWFGLSELIGNFIASRIIDRAGAARVVAVCLALIITAFVIWPLAEGSMKLTMLSILIWGLGGFAIHPSQQARLVAVAPNLASASAALNSSGTYLGQMLGSVLGGRLIRGFSTNALACGGAVLLLAASGTAFAAGRSQAPKISC